MEVQSQSAMIAGLILLSLAVNVLFERRRVEHRVAFASLLLSFSLFNFSWFLFSVTGSHFWRGLLLISSIAIAHASLSFFERVLETTLRTWRTLASVASGFILIVIPTDFNDEPLVSAMAGSLAFGTYTLCISRLYQRYKSTTNRVESTRLGYLVYGGFVSIILSTIDLLPALELPTPALGHVWTTVYMYFWMQVVLRSRLLDLQDILGRGLALLALASVISLAYVALLIWVDGSIGLFFFNTVVASVLVVLIYEPLKRAIEVWVGRLLFRSTHDLENTISKIRSQLANVISLEALFDRVIKGLEGSRRITHASILMLETGGHRYVVPRPGAQLGEMETKHIDVVGGRAFLDLLMSDQVLSMDGIAQELLDAQVEAVDSGSRAQLESTRRIMESLSADISFAIMAGERLIGFLNVRDDRTEEAFSSYEISLFASLTAQVTTAVENSELVRKLNNRDRLSALGEMATGMAHEIRNPLGAVKSAAQLLTPDAEDDDAKSLFKVIIDETNRLGTVLEQFLDFARPYEGALQGFDVAHLVRNLHALISADPSSARFTIQLHIDDSIPKAFGDPDQIHRVLLNLVRNSTQAMGSESGSIDIRVQLIREPLPGQVSGLRQRIEVSVSDSGPGISPDVKQNLFIPFYTTKPSGTGLGLAICQRIMQRHGTEIRVDSILNQGTTMSFRLFLEDDADAFTGEHGRLLTAGGASSWSG